MKCETLSDMYREWDLDQIYWELRRKRMLEESGLSPLDLENTFETFRTDPEWGGNTEALEICKRFAAGFQPGDGVGLLLWGKRGVGKSHLCAGISLVLLNRGIMVRKYSVPELLARGRSLFAAHDDEEIAELWQNLAQTPVVWLDEFTLDTVGNGVYESNRAIEVLYRVINTVVEAKAGLLITTNHPPGELAAGLRRHDPTERIMDRLRAVVHPVEVKGESNRARLRRERIPDYLAPGPRGSAGSARSGGPELNDNQI